MSNIKAPFIRSPYNYDTAAASDEATVKDFGPTSTVQSMTEDADINVIMARFKITGQMPTNPRIPSFVELDKPLDYRSALEYVQDAQDAFMEYPAQLRARFNNNPQEFLEFTSNPANLAEMRTLGLAKPEPPEPPAAAPPAAK